MGIEAGSRTSQSPKVVNNALILSDQINKNASRAMRYILPAPRHNSTRTRARPTDLGLRERVPGFQTGEGRVVAIRGQQFCDAVPQADGRDPGFVQSRPTHSRAAETPEGPQIVGRLP